MDQQYQPNQNQGYNPNYQQPVPATPKKASGVSIAALICGICGFFINPFYLVNLSAIILGIVGIATAKDSPKGMAIAGLVIGLCAMICQFIVDLVLSIFTLGLSFLI